MWLLIVFLLVMGVLVYWSNKTRVSYYSNESGRLKPCEEKKATHRFVRGGGVSPYWQLTRKGLRNAVIKSKSKRY